MTEGTVFGVQPGNVDTPEWVRDAVFYQIFPDRFAKSDRLPKPSGLERWDSDPTTYGYKGGDLLGVVEHLDYLRDLGITALYFNPVFQSACNHRYHTHDYFQVDPLLGGNDAFDQMLEACHRRGIRVVLDGVLNHAPGSTGSPSTTSRSTPTTTPSHPATRPGSASTPCPSSTRTTHRSAIT